jgi:hypothetical protein
MTEALLTNERCFLEQDAWKDVMRSVIVDDTLISDRSQIVIELMILKSNIPGFFVDITNILLSENEPDYVHINAVACKIHQLRVDLLKWHSDYESVLSSAQPIYPGSAEYDRRCKVFATYLSCVIISSRLLGAISPTERVELEEETQVLAGQMLDLEIEVKSTSSAACLFMAQTLGVAQATIGTSGDWLREEYEGEGEGVEKLESVSPEGFVSLESVSPEYLVSPTSATSRRFSECLTSPIGFTRSESGSTRSGDLPRQKALLEVWKFKKWNKLCGRKLPV